MKSITFVHASDFHLDAPLCGGYGDYSSVRRSDIRKAFSSTIDLVISESADLLLLSGDLFEQDSVTRDTLFFVRQMLNRLTSTHVVILPGNHDPLLINSWYRAFDWPIHVHLLDVKENKPASVWLEDLQIFIAGYGFTTYRQEEPDWVSLPDPKQNALNILMFHGSLDVPNGPILYNPITTDKLMNSGYHYIAMGHFHNYFIKQGMPFIANPGSPEPLGFDEPNTHGVILGTWSSDQKHILAELIPIAAKKFSEEDVNISSCSDVDSVKMAILSHLENRNPEKDCIHLRLTGTQIESIFLDNILDEFREEWLLLRISDNTHPAIQWRNSFQENSLVGYFITEMEQKIKKAESSDDIESLQKVKRAMQMGMEALAYGVVYDVNKTEDSALNSTDS